MNLSKKLAARFFRGNLIRSRVIAASKSGSFTDEMVKGYLEMLARRMEDIGSVLRKLTLSINSVAGLTAAIFINHVTEVSFLGAKFDNATDLLPWIGVLSAFLCYRYTVTFNRLALLWQIQHEMIRLRLRPFCDQGLDEAVAPTAFQGPYAARWSDFLAENRYSARVRVWLGKVFSTFPASIAGAIAASVLVFGVDQPISKFWPFWLATTFFAFLVTLEYIPLNPRI
ncbi:hypothetical protein [Actinoplanes sp. L3-i22]|uniref:hypothetical protein n=1 Tax=Actinoplanes sp. L3-i22 TaxID=2836373 RepID=UPI001C857373|nr:hypothetical protein [Actinoplanes sp. L3-i22]